MTDDAIFAITFHTKEDFEKARLMSQTLQPDDINASDLEMIWSEEWWRNQAVHELSTVGVTVDTWEL